MPVRGNTMNTDELAQALKDWFDQAESTAEAWPDEAVGRRALGLLKAMHSIANVLQRDLTDAGVIQPFSSGDKDPPGGP